MSIRSLFHIEKITYDHIYIFTRINIINVKYRVKINGEKERNYLYFLYSC
jgi:hypothetical protein